MMIKYTKPEVEVKELVAIEEINAYSDWASDNDLDNGVTTFGLASSGN